MVSSLVNRENSQLRKVYVDSTTSSALVRTLLCLEALIEDLLGEGYDFLLTSRFQSNSLERQFGQYRQRSGF